MNRAYYRAYPLYDLRCSCVTTASLVPTGPYRTVTEFCGKDFPFLCAIPMCKCGGRYGNGIYLSKLYACWSPSQELLTSIGINTCGCMEYAFPVSCYTPDNMQCISASWTNVRAASIDSACPSYTSCTTLSGWLRDYYGINGTKVAAFVTWGLASNTACSNCLTTTVCPWGNRTAGGYYKQTLASSLNGVNGWLGGPVAAIFKSCSLVCSSNRWALSCLYDATSSTCCTCYGYYGALNSNCECYNYGYGSMGLIVLCFSIKGLKDGVTIGTPYCNCIDCYTKNILTIYPYAGGCSVTSICGLSVCNATNNCGYYMSPVHGSSNKYQGSFSGSLTCAASLGYGSYVGCTPTCLADIYRNTFGGARLVLGSEYAQGNWAMPLFVWCYNGRTLDLASAFELCQTNYYRMTMDAGVSVNSYTCNGWYSGQFILQASPKCVGMAGFYTCETMKCPTISPVPHMPAITTTDLFDIGGVYSLTNYCNVYPATCCSTCSYGVAYNYALCRIEDGTCTCCGSITKYNAVPMYGGGYRTAVYNPGCVFSCCPECTRTMGVYGDYIIQTPQFNEGDMGGRYVPFNYCRSIRVSASPSVTYDYVTFCSNENR